MSPPPALNRVKVVLTATLFFFFESVYFFPVYSHWCCQVHVKKIKRNLFFAKVTGVQNRPFLPGGSGKWFILRKLPHPTRVIWRKFVSMTVRLGTSDTMCWLPGVIQLLKVKCRDLFLPFERCSWFSPHTRLQNMKISSARFLYRNLKGTKHTNLLIEWKPAVLGRALRHRWRTAGIDWVVSVISLTPLKNF